MSTLALDIATAPLPDAAKFLGEFTAPSTWKDPAKIKAEVERKRQAALAGAALDPDLARITAVGMAWGKEAPIVLICRYKEEEREALHAVAEELDAPGAVTVTFGGINFDLPMLERRARYLGVPFPKLDLDRYRSPHHDLCELLANRRPDRRRSLDFYVTRLGWAEELVKPLSGEGEAKVHETGEWELLRQSVERDVRAVRRLARWMGLMDQPPAEAGKEGSHEASHHRTHRSRRPAPECRPAGAGNGERLPVHRPEGPARRGGDDRLHRTRCRAPGRGAVG